MDFLWAFLVGGAICVVGQLLIDLTKLTPARILVSFVVLGVVLEGFGLYQHLVDFAGCGATVPLTGFGYTLAKGTREMIDSTGWLGILTGPLSAGAAGISAAIVSGLIAAFLTRSKPK
ncbi:MAG: stage V sporulation protein AE [Clostridia bacterium]|nr:stage V sporulation protein AE [Clostridia bacterium]MBQ7044358.1 stage V sporulation protein AE [Clostridia bacterium]